MTDRGLPIVDGAPACPFVAYEDDRDARAFAPDHRHRCFAEPRPAPRALAHQEAYCLSSAFPVCPTFQDWARREAAAARQVPLQPEPIHDEPPVSRAMPPLEREPRHSSIEPEPLPPRRNPPRDWAAPPPWADGDEPDDAEPPAFLGARDRAREDDQWGGASRGLAGSAAHRLAGEDPDELAARPEPLPPFEGHPIRPADDTDDLWPSEPEAAGSAYAEPSRRAIPPGGGPADERAARLARGRAGERPSRDRAAGERSSHDQVHVPVDDPVDLFGPAWEQPRRYEAYPSLRTRVGIPDVPRAGLAFIALVLAALALFLIGPNLLGFGLPGGGGGGAGASALASPSVAPSVAPTPSLEPAPSVYVVVRGDTMSKIANKLHVTLEQLLAANKQIKNPDKIKIGDQINIPGAGSGGASAAAKSAAP